MRNPFYFAVAFILAAAPLYAQTFGGDAVVYNNNPPLMYNPGAGGTFLSPGLNNATTNPYTNDRFGAGSGRYAPQPTASPDAYYTNPALQPSGVGMANNAPTSAYQPRLFGVPSATAEQQQGNRGTPPGARLVDLLSTHQRYQDANGNLVLTNEDGAVITVQSCIPTTGYTKQTQFQVGSVYCAALPAVR